MVAVVIQFRFSNQSEFIIFFSLILNLKKNYYFHQPFTLLDGMFNPLFYCNSVYATCGVRFIQNNDLFKYFMDFKKRDKQVKDKSF